MAPSANRLKSLRLIDNNIRTLANRVEQQYSRSTRERPESEGPIG
jgi:hypothetical protein